MKKQIYNKFHDICRIRSAVDHIQICLVDTEALTRRYFPGVSLTDHALKPWLFDEVLFLSGVELPSEFASFRVFKRQIEWLAGRLAFAILDDLFLGGGHGIGRRESGEPYIIGLKNHISITHAGGFAAAAVALDDSRVGIDLERVREFDDRESFLSVAFPEEEKENLASLADRDIMTLWTLKESFLKIIGRGFAESLRTVKITPDYFEYRKERFDSFNRWTDLFEDHLISGIWCDPGTAEKCRNLYNA
jgi:phosphopantetheinyl transferase